MRCPHFLVFSGFCFPSPFFLFLGEHNSLLHTSNPRESTSLPARRYAHQFSSHGPVGPCLMAFLAPDAWYSWLCRNVCWWAHCSPDGGGGKHACTRRGTRFCSCRWHLIPPLLHLCDLFIDPVEFHESARRISGLGTRCRGSRSGLTFDTRLFFLEDPTTLFTTTFVRFCDESHVLSRFGDAGYVLGYPF